MKTVSNIDFSFLPSVSVALFVGLFKFIIEEKQLMQMHEVHSLYVIQVTAYLPSQ